MNRTKIFEVLRSHGSWQTASHAALCSSICNRVSGASLPCAIIGTNASHTHEAGEAEEKADWRRPALEAGHPAQDAKNSNDSQQVLHFIRFPRRLTRNGVLKRVIRSQFGIRGFFREMPLPCLAPGTQGFQQKGMLPSAVAVFTFLNARLPVSLGEIGKNRLNCLQDCYQEGHSRGAWVGYQEIIWVADSLP